MAKGAGGSRRSSSSRSSSSSRDIFGEREQPGALQAGKVGSRGWVLTDASEVTDQANLIAVGVAGEYKGKIGAGYYPGGVHARMLMYAGITKGEDWDATDNFVRFRLNPGQGLMHVDTAYTGVKDYSLPREEFNAKSIDNVYSAARRLVGKGLPRSTRIQVFGAGSWDTPIADFTAGEAFD